MMTKICDDIIQARTQESVRFPLNRSTRPPLALAELTNEEATEVAPEIVSVLRREVSRLRLAPFISVRLRHNPRAPERFTEETAATSPETDEGIADFVTDIYGRERAERDTCTCTRHGR